MAIDWMAPGDDIWEARRVGRQDRDEEVEDLAAEVERLRGEVADTRAAVKLAIGRKNDVPWREVSEENVHGYVQFVREQLEKP